MRIMRGKMLAEQDGKRDEREQLLEDVRQAHLEWTMAQWRFHDAIGYDQVDYAIYALEAAEKKYDMLLRKAKRLWAAGASVAEDASAGGDADGEPGGAS
jgi:hypothetical protein